MSFQAPITIKEAVENIRRKKYLLPAIQREVVWDCDQIEKLFDSVMRDYPIGSFLFWHVERKNTSNYQFYEFMCDYSQRNNYHNAKANVTGQDDVIGILDGQQRLTSLYLGLLGSYTYKEPRKRWDNPAAYPARRLYLNLLSSATDEEEGMFFDFRFLKDNEAQERDEENHWFRVGDILDLEQPHQVNDYLLDKGLMQEKNAKLANRTLFKFRQVIHEALTINYFLERDERLDKVLQIFIRVNSGGTTLSYSDLLLSVATAQWKNRDAREEIYNTVDDINTIGKGFAIDKDMILKAALVLSDFKDIAFKVDNFNKANMLNIEAHWADIRRALESAVELVASFGFSRDTLTSNYALIPIAYYLYKLGLPKNFHLGKGHAADRDLIHQWLIWSLVKRSFGGKPDNVLSPIRDVLAKKGSPFPLESIAAKFKGTPKALEFSDDDIENLLDSRYGEPYTFALLALLYPTLDFRNLFHIDHIHPRSLFTKTQLVKRGVANDAVETFAERVDLLPNLQLIEGIPNQEKSDSDFDVWFGKTLKTRQAQADYRAKNYIPAVDLRLANFDEFFDKRRELLKAQLEKLLRVT